VWITTTASPAPSPLLNLGWEHFPAPIETPLLVQEGTRRAGWSHAMLKLHRYPLLEGVLSGGLSMLRYRRRPKDGASGRWDDAKRML
jgi:hypothetical protein